MNSLIKRVSAILAGGALAFSGVALGASAPAAAATSPIDVTSLSVGSSTGSVMSYSTKFMKIGTYMRVGDLGEYGTATVYADVYRGSTRLQANVQIGYASSSGYSSTTGGFSFSNGWGRGPFRVANVRVRWNVDGNTYWFTDTSYTGGGFTIKSGIDGNLKYGNVISIKSRGSRKSVTVGVKYYSPTGWKPYGGKKVVVQYKAGSWKKKKTLRLNRKGKASFSFSTSTKRKYRVKIASTSTVQGGYSRATIKV